MKIVFVTSCRQHTNGGVGKIAFEIPYFFSKTSDVLFIFPGTTTRLVVGKRLSRLEIKSQGNGELFVPSLGLKDLDFIFDCLEKFQPEVVHAQDPGPVSLFIQQWTKKKNLPFITTTHFLPTKFNRFGSWESQQSEKIKIFKGLLKKFFNDCDALVALNSIAQEDIKKFGYKGKVAVIPNGRDLKKFQTHSPKKDTKGTKKLIFVGDISNRKNQEYLLEMKKSLPDNYVLEFVGRTLEPKYYERLVYKIKKEEIKNVNFLGTVEYERIPFLLKEADLFVSASTMEVQSLAVIEAMAAGIIVVGLKNETIEELVDNSCGFKFPKYIPPKVFAKKVKEICEMKEADRQKMGLLARKRVAFLEWELVVKKTLAFYEEVVKEREGSLDNWESGKDSWKGAVLYLAIVVFFFASVYFGLINYLKDLREKI